MVNPREEFLKTARDARQPLIVVVDDEQGTLDLLTDVLKSMDVRILTATDPDVGLNLIKQNRPQIVFLDLNMPKLSGMQLLEMVVNFDPAIEVIKVGLNQTWRKGIQVLFRRRGGHNAAADTPEVPYPS